MFSEKIQRLTAFPHSLIYHFVAESIGNQQSASVFENFYIPCFMQFNDVLNAYLHIQDTLLPEIQAQGLERITPAKWQSYFKSLHCLMTKTLSKHQDFTSGEIRNGNMIISKDNKEILTFIYVYLRNNIAVSKEDFCENLADEFSLPVESILTFLQLIDSMKTREDITLLPSSLDMIKENDLGMLCLERLINAYMTEQLTEEQKRVIEEIGMPCPFPERIAGLLSCFFEELHLRLHALDKGNSLDIANLMSYVFQKLISIHPFCNGNGRTVMCFVNLLLKGLNQNPVCFYYSHEKNDIGSEYIQATQAIFKNHEPLMHLIHKRLHQEIPEDAFGFEKTRVYVDFCEFLIAQHERNPHKPIDRIFYEESNKYRTSLGFSDKIQLNAQQTLMLFKQIMTQSPTLSRITTLFSMHSVDMAQLLNLQFPHHQSWKYYPRQQIALLECRDLDEANRVAKTIKDTGAMKATPSKILETGVFVVKATEINLEKVVGLKTISP